MNIELFITYILATIFIVAIPGPNILLIISDSVAYGFKNSIMTVAGITLGMALLFALSLAGIATLLVLYSWLFSVIKWAGVCYLIYLGITQIIGSYRSSHIKTKMKETKRSLFSKGFLISATNPKGLVFAGAFFPQFLNPDAEIVPQIIALCGGFLAIAFSIGILYAFCCDTAKKIFKAESFKNYVDRISGVALTFFGIGLALTNEEKNGLTNQ